MALYVGFYRNTPGFAEENQARVRGGGEAVDPKFRRLVTELPDKLPASCKIIGSYGVGAGNVLTDPGPPNVMIVETDNTGDLTFISQYYSGYLAFHWLPATSVGATRQEREATMAAIAAPAGVR